MNPPRFPAWMLRKDPAGCRRVLERNLNESGLMGRYVVAVSPWCGACSWFVGATRDGHASGACPGVFSRTAAEPPICFRDARGSLVALPGFGGQTRREEAAA